MNRDTARSQTHDCCGTPATSTATATNGLPCPACGGKGKAVKTVTLQSLLKPEPKARIGEHSYLYCGNPECRIVYYANHGPTFSTDDMAVRVGVKEKSPPQHVCYCFNHTIEQIEDEVRRTGQSTVLDDIKERMKVACWCETKSPMGSCCLSTVAQYVKAALAKHGDPMSSSTAPQRQQEGNTMNDDTNESQTHQCCASSDGSSVVDAGNADSPSRAGFWSGLGAVGAAVGASACCWLPLLLLTVGLSAGGVAGFFEKARPVFLVAAAIFLAAGFYFAYYRNPVCQPGDACAVPNPKLQRFNRAMLWVATIFVIAFAMFPSYSPALIRASASPTSSKGSGTIDTTTPLTAHTYHIEGMTCAACAAGLESQIAKLPGVVDVDVSYENSTATIQMADRQPDQAGLREVVERSGFKLTTP